MAVALVGLALTYALVQQQRSASETIANVRFTEEVRSSANAIEQRIVAYTEIVAGMGDLFLVNPDLGYRDFERVAAERSIRQRYPEIRNLHFSRWVPTQGLPAFTQRLRAQGQQVAAGAEGEHALRFFADRVEGNLLAAHQEIQKLALLYPEGELGAAQIESAVLNVARYDAFKLGEAVLAGQVERVERMLDGLEAEGESAVLVHYVLAEDIRALARVRQSMDGGKPLPMALREQRVWGLRERLFERVVPRLDGRALARLVHAAHVVDGIVKGIRVPEWPDDPWQALQRLAFMVCRQMRAAA